MQVQTAITEKLNAALTPQFLDVQNESSNHNVPAGSESHFKVVVASSRFEGMRRVARHRLVNQILADELAGAVHALALHVMTPEEFSDSAGQAPASPDCRGGDGTFST